MTNHHVVRLAAVAAAVAMPLAAHAQAHQRSFEEYVVRSSVVSTEFLPPRTLREHGFERSGDTALLNVTVLKRGSELMETVPARVQAHVTGLTGTPREIPMNETRSDGWVSYSGTFRFAPREILDFSIRAEPIDTGKRLDLEYRERMWADGD